MANHSLPPLEALLLKTQSLVYLRTYNGDFSLEFTTNQSFERGTESLSEIANIGWIKSIDLYNRLIYFQCPTVVNKLKFFAVISHQMNQAGFKIMGSCSNDSSDSSVLNILSNNSKSSKSIKDLFNNNIIKNKFNNN